MIRPLTVPVLYALELTDRCDQHCPGCSNVFARSRSAPAPLSARDWNRVLQQIAPHASQLKFTGGEPTLHPEFETILRQADVLGLDFSLFTNGHWPHPPRTVALLRSLAHCVGLLISLHGPDDRTHEAFTGLPGSFEPAVDSIRRAVAAGLPVVTSTVITRHNCDRLPELAALAAGLGADHAVFSRYLGPPLPIIEPDEAELRAASAAIERLRGDGHRVRYGDCLPQCFVRNSSTGCLAGVAYCTLDPWGNLRPCNHSPLVVGNLLEQPLEALWWSEPMGRWRELIPAACHACAAFPTCHGGCRALAEIHPLQRDPLVGRPLAELPAPEPLVLHADLRPLPRYRVRREPFGLVLLRGNSVVPLPFAAQLLLEALDGRHTLRDVGRLYGDPGLELVAELARRGLVDLQPPVPDSAARN